MLDMGQEHENQVFSSVQERVLTLRQELSALIQEEVVTQRIDRREALLLSLRLGLIDGECTTLQKTGEILQISPEWIRQRQYFLLKRKVNNPAFFAKLKEYRYLVRLPKGIIMRQASGEARFCDVESEIDG